jgi:chemosensory pili system protein ChpA (sensor histidine kinase/response regulator)
MLRRLAEPMPMLGLEPLGPRLERCAAAIESVCKQPSQNHRRIDDIAHALSQVDAKLRASGPDVDADDSRLSHGRGLAAATLRETRLELRAVCEDLDPERNRSPTLERLRTCHETLAGLPEALRATGETSLSLIIADLVDQINLRYLQTRQLPGDAGLELINRALNGAEVHLEDRLTRNEIDARMLAEAAHAVERLTVLLPADEDLEVDPDSSEGSDSLPESESSQSVNLEFLTLFLDEARDELENINEQLKRWGTDTSDLIALSSLRSSF